MTDQTPEDPQSIRVSIPLDLGHPDRMSPAATAGIIGQTVTLSRAFGAWHDVAGKALIHDARVEGEDGEYLVLTLHITSGEAGPLGEAGPTDPKPAAMGFQVEAAHRDDAGVRIFDRVIIREVGPLSAQEPATVLVEPTS